MVTGIGVGNGGADKGAGAGVTVGLQATVTMNRAATTIRFILLAFKLKSSNAFN